MQYWSRIGKALAGLMLCSLASGAAVGWQLDGNNSTVSFISIKNTSVAETHSFGKMAGGINPQGEVGLSIDLASVETLVPIRNERMRELLFDVAKFPSAEITTRVDRAVIDTAAAGGVVMSIVPVTLALHGMEKSVDIPVVIAGTEGGALLVISSQPVLINAADFGLDKGLDALQAAAGLKSISHAVPVSIRLLFLPAP